MLELGKYRKVIVAFVGFLLAAANVYLGENNEIVGIIVPILATLGVYQVPNSDV